MYRWGKFCANAKKSTISKINTLLNKKVVNKDNSDGIEQLEIIKKIKSMENIEKDPVSMEMIIIIQEVV